MMAHAKQRQFCKEVKRQFPEYFKAKRVLDIGSLDVNGNNRSLFDDCIYIGLDLTTGKNVDVVCHAHLYPGRPRSFDTIISTEAFEHDKFLSLTFPSIIHMLKPLGLFFFTCAADGRPEHGTRKATPQDSPETLDYYGPVSAEIVLRLLDMTEFEQWSITKDNKSHDLRFWGIKKSKEIT